MPSMKRAAFKGTRLSENTYLITEHSDIYNEHPFIYVRIFSSFNTILVIDTGCGGATDDQEIEITSLREFIETANPDSDAEHGDGKPLNEGGKLAYAVALTHCHYDHICACNPTLTTMSIRPHQSRMKSVVCTWY